VVVGAGIGMTINLSGHLMLVTQCDLAMNDLAMNDITMNDTYVFRLSTHMHHFQVIECDVYV